MNTYAHRWKAKTHAHTHTHTHTHTHDWKERNDVHICTHLQYTSIYAHICVYQDRFIYIRFIHKHICTPMKSETLLDAKARKRMCKNAHIYSVCRYMHTFTCIKLHIHINAYANWSKAMPEKEIYVCICGNICVYMHTSTTYVVIRKYLHVST